MDVDDREAPGRRRMFGRWPLIIAGFGVLLTLMIASAIATWTKATRLYADLSILNQEYQLDWRSLDEVRSGIHVSSVLVRDYLLDPSRSRAREIRDELLKLRSESEPHIQRMEKSAVARSQAALRQLRAEVQGYWDTLDPVFDWTPQEKQAAAYGFLRQRIIPRREAVLSLADEVQAVMDSAFQQERQAVHRSEQEFQAFFLRTVTATVLLGVVVATLTILRLRRLEQRWREQQALTERAEDEMRRLSHEVVRAQEAERRSISRELHDEVGQMLTGLRMDLRGLRKVYRTDPEGFDRRIEQTRVLLEQTLQSVRNIAMGLRPSVLDDLGLQAAIEWQARDFERTHEIAVALEIRADLDALPEGHRTHIYRIIQEALTNCARHASAKHIAIQIDRTQAGTLVLSIEDDGVGLKDERSTGLGLIGMKERVRELKGEIRIESLPGRGARVSVDLPEEVIAVE